MNRQEALELIKKYVKNENSIKHMLAAEAIMTALAKHFNASALLSASENEEAWGLAGLLHDIDMETVDYRTNPEKHGMVGADMLEKMGVDMLIINAIRAHNQATGKTRDNLIEKSIYAADCLTGLIVASTLVLPSKKINDLTLENVLNRFKEKSFARGARREAIASCNETGLSLEEFVKIGLEAMQSIATDLGL